MNRKDSKNPYNDSQSKMAAKPRKDAKNLHKGTVTSSFVLVVLGFFIVIAMGINFFIFFMSERNSAIQQRLEGRISEPIKDSVEYFQTPLQDDDDLVRAVVKARKSTKDNRSKDLVEEKDDVPGILDSKASFEQTGREIANSTTIRNEESRTSSETIGKNELDKSEGSTLANATDRPETVAATGLSNTTFEKIQVFKSPQELAWMHKRTQLFEQNVIKMKMLRGLFEEAKNDVETNYVIDSGENPIASRLYIKEKLALALNNLTIGNDFDPAEGPYLDFMVAGNPKCGTTTLMANLRKIAPMPVKDVCVGVSHALRLVYNMWPNSHNYTDVVKETLGDDPALWLRGNKCPKFLNSNLVLGYSRILPKTKYIIGIRHPVGWFTSFWNMGALGTVLNNINLCPCPVNPVTGVRDRTCPQIDPKERCDAECRCGSTFCLHRSRLHLPLARLGKTNLTREERQWLAPNDADGGMNLFNAKIPNPIFLYDQGQMKKESYWDDLAKFLGLSHIPNTEYHGSHGSSGRKKKTLCIPKYDYFRSKMMSYSYEMANWIQLYLLPVADDPNRTDVVIAGTASEFHDIVETYKSDPCNRLVRRDSDGIYVLKEGVQGALNNTAEYDPVYGSIDTKLPPQCVARNKTKGARKKGKGTTESGAEDEDAEDNEAGDDETGDDEDEGDDEPRT